MHRRFLFRFLFVARLMVALGCFQMSGYGHMVTDLLVSFGVLPEHTDDCDDEDSRECPPGCPTCHCTHCISPALAASPRADALAPAVVAMVSTLEETDRGTKSPDLPHVYRPPRATVSFI